jgi:hypothetical protein
VDTQSLANYLELLLFLRMNKDMWDVTDVQNVLDELAEKVAAAPEAVGVPVRY